MEWQAFTCYYSINSPDWENGKQNKPPHFKTWEWMWRHFPMDINFGTENGALWWKVYNHHVNLHLLSAKRLNFDVVSTHVFDGETMLLTRRCNNVVFKLNDVATSFQLVFNVETTSVCPLGSRCVWCVQVVRQCVRYIEGQRWRNGFYRFRHIKSLLRGVSAWRDDVYYVWRHNISIMMKRFGEWVQWGVQKLHIITDILTSELITPKDFYGSYI